MCIRDSHNEHLGKFTNVQTQNKLIPEQIQINTKHDTILKALNIENTQNTNIYITITHNNTNGASINRSEFCYLNEKYLLFCIN